MNTTSLAILLTAALCAGDARAQTTWYVDVNGQAPGSGSAQDPYTSIQYCLERATTVDGDTVLVLPGTYAEAIDFVGKAVALRSRDGALTTIVSAPGGSAVTCAAGETLQSLLAGFTIEGGTGSSGGLYGGGLYCEASSPTIEDCTFRQNGALMGGGAYLKASGARFLRCTFDSNDVGGPVFGGGLNLEPGCDVLLDGCVITRNRALSGAGIWASGSTLELNDCSVRGNVGLTGIGVYAFDSTCVIADSAFEDNVADGNSFDRGGGLYLDGTATLSSCTIRGNGAPAVGVNDGRGGGIYGVGTITADGCTIEDNRAYVAGGGIHGTGSYSNCTIRGNAGGFGGGVYASPPAGSLTLTDCVVSDNTALSRPGDGGQGGGVYGPAQLEGCRLEGNTAWHELDDSLGGGASGATLIDCEVLNNVAGNEYHYGAGIGGGLYDCVAARCVLSGNQAIGSVGPSVYPAQGGGAASSTLMSCTLLGNGGTPLGAGEGGGGAYSCILTNCIVWDSHPFQTLASSATYCDVQGGEPGIGNIDQDPLLWSLAQGDYHLRPGSPCIDAGDPTSPLDPDGSRADIGAFPYSLRYVPEPIVFCTAKLNSCGSLPAISAAGTPRASYSSGFLVSVSGTRAGKPGLLLTTDSGPAAVPFPFSGGLLCLELTGLRRSILVTDTTGTPGACDGTLAIDLNAFASGVLGGNPAATLAVPGTIVDCQWWARDTSANGALLSDALEYLVGP